MRVYGLIGFPLAQSFSKKYFTQKFAEENIPDCKYELFEIDRIERITEVLKNNPGLQGLNVTIPYKQSVIPYLNETDPQAASIGAVNCIAIHKGILRGFNTDAAAFETSLLPGIKSYHRAALVLGSGGASKAVTYILQKLGIEYTIVSRAKRDKGMTYDELTPDIIQQHLLIINTTPLGSFPKTDALPAIPYDSITERHYLYDLIYNPAETMFLKRGMEKKATVKNGYEMLVNQAELGWRIWNK